MGAVSTPCPSSRFSLRDHGLDVPAGLAAIADDTGDGAQEWCFAQGRERLVRLYHYKTRAVAMGTAAHYRWGEWGYQETVLQLRLGHDPDAQIWINHPGETLHSGHGRPSYWGGSGTLPRLHQYRGLAVMLFDCAEEQPDFTHAWFPHCGLRRDIVAGQHRAGPVRRRHGAPQGKHVVPQDRRKDRPQDSELRLPGRRGAWIVRLGEKRLHGSPDDFARAFSALSFVTHADGSVVIDDPDYGEVVFRKDGRVSAEGRTLDPDDWSVGGRRLSCRWEHCVRTDEGEPSVGEDGLGGS